MGHFTMGDLTIEKMVRPQVISVILGQREFDLQNIF